MVRSAFGLSDKCQYKGLHRNDYNSNIASVSLEERQKDAEYYETLPINTFETDPLNSQKDMQAKHSILTKLKENASITNQKLKESLTHSASDNKVDDNALTMSDNKTHNNLKNNLKNMKFQDCNTHKNEWTTFWNDMGQWNNANEFINLIFVKKRFIIVITIILLLSLAMALIK